MSQLYETDLFDPVKRYFQAQGYKVQAEVYNCDIVAIREGSLVIIELKLNLNITLLMQAAQRQRITPNVYIAIKRPKTSLRKKKWRDLVHLIRRLELGLILLSFEDEEPSLKVIHKPGSFNRKRSLRQNGKIKNRIIQEAIERRSCCNIGGSHRVPTMTVYKETSIQIALYFDHFGPMSSKELQSLGTNYQTYRILYNNYYKWFKRVARGVYDLTELGRKEYKNYSEIIELYLKSDIKRKNNPLNE